MNYNQIMNCFTLIIVVCSVFIFKFNEWDLKLLDFFFLDGYKSLWHKFNDNSELSKKAETAHIRRWLGNNYDFLRRQLLKDRYYRACLEFTRAYNRNDFDTMFEIILEAERSANGWD